MAIHPRPSEWLRPSGRVHPKGRGILAFSRKDIGPSHYLQPELIIQSIQEKLGKADSEDIQGGPPYLPVMPRANARHRFYRERGGCEKILHHHCSSGNMKLGAFCLAIAS